MRLGRAAAWLAPILAMGCAHGRNRLATAEARSFYYTDSSGLSVLTTGALVEHPINGRLAISARGIADYIRLEPKQLNPGPVDPGMPTGHPPGPDAVTSASSTIANGSLAEKWRFEGLVALTAQGDVLGAPAALRVQARTSQESDYDSYSALAAATTSLFERNTTVTGFFGYGRDSVTPPAAPAGQTMLWPADHDRWQLGATVSQVVSPRVVASAGLAATFQRGMLASPYRNALVRTTLFPEVEPNTRDRYVGFVGAAIYLGLGTAAHLQAGVYADSWDVAAIIPEAALSKDVGDRVTANVHYRFYAQSAASFYRARYDDLAPILSGDPRLGSIREHATGAELRYLLRGDRFLAGAISLIGGYDASWVDYELLGADTVVAHVFNAGISIVY